MSIASARLTAAPARASHASARSGRETVGSLSAATRALRARSSVCHEASGPGRGAPCRSSSGGCQSTGICGAGWLRSNPAMLPWRSAAAVPCAAPASSRRRAWGPSSVFMMLDQCASAACKASLARSFRSSLLPPRCSVASVPFAAVEWVSWRARCHTPEATNPGRGATSCSVPLLAGEQARVLSSDNDHWKFRPDARRRRALTEGPRESGVAALANNRLNAEDVVLNDQGRR